MDEHRTLKEKSVVRAGVDHAMRMLLTTALLVEVVVIAEVRGDMIHSDENPFVPRLAVSLRR